MSLKYLEDHNPDVFPVVAVPPWECIAAFFGGDEVHISSEHPDEFDPGSMKPRGNRPLRSAKKVRISARREFL